MLKSLLNHFQPNHPLSPSATGAPGDPVSRAPAVLLPLALP